MMGEIFRTIPEWVTMLVTLFGVYYAWKNAVPMMQETHAKTNELVKKTSELVEHTNSLTDKLVEKTDLAGIAAGIAQEQARSAKLADQSAPAAAILADVLAKALIAAADIAAEKVLAAAKVAKDLAKEA